MTDATPTTEEKPVPLNKKGKPHLREISKARTRERLIEAGRRLFDQRGYIDATIRDIAREAGLSTGAIFGVFPEGKPALYQAITGHPVITPEEGAKAMVILRALTMDDDQADEMGRDMVDELRGIDAAVQRAGTLLDEIGIPRLSTADIEDDAGSEPGTMTYADIVIAALERPL